MFSYRTLLLVALIAFWSWMSSRLVPAGGGSGNFFVKAPAANDAGWGMDPNGGS